MIGKLIWFSIQDGEKKSILRDLKFLRDHMRYIDIILCTVDGSVSIATAFKEIYPEAVLHGLICFSLINGITQILRDQVTS